MKDLIKAFGLTVAFTIMGVLALIAAIAAIAAGLSIFGGLFMAILVVIVIYFGSIQELAASIVVGYLLKAFDTDIANFVGIWWTGPSATAFFALVKNTGYIKIIIVIFFLAYTLSFFTSRIQLFHIRMGGSISSSGSSPTESDSD